MSNLRLQRFHRWAMLWLKWFVAFLDGAGVFAPLSKHAEAIGHRWLDDIERVIVNIVMLRAAPRVLWPHQRRGVSAHRRNDTGKRRAIIGTQLRRLLRPQGLRQRIEALSQSLSPLIARLLRRLPRGLTRRRPIIATAERHNAVAPSAPLPSTLAVDTS